MSIRRAASCCQPRHDSAVPRGACTGSYDAMITTLPPRRARQPTLAAARRTPPCDHLGMSERRSAECWLTDMDGVLVDEGRPIPGAIDFIARLEASGQRYRG